MQALPVTSHRASQVKEMVKHYITAKKLGTGVAKIRTLNPYGKGVLEVPTLEEFSKLLQRSENIALSK